MTRRPGVGAGECGFEKRGLDVAKRNCQSARMSAVVSLPPPEVSSRADELLALAAQYLYPNYQPAPYVMVSGRGCSVSDVTGRTWLDFTAGVAVSSLGHAHPALAAAIAEQAGKVLHVSNYFYNEPNILLASELCTRSGFDRALFCNSGAEAIEGLFKLARRYFFVNGEHRTKVIAFEQGFHGRTAGALSLTGTAKYREGFGTVEGVVHVPYGDTEAVRRVIDSSVAAVLVEPVQGEGGVIPAPSGFLRDLREACTEHGALLFCDEVQTGVGRLGTWFGFEQSDIRPDAIALAKGLAGGVPIGAMLTTEALARALPPGTHGTTFGGNPLACTAARTVLRVLDEEGIVAAVEGKGNRLASLLRAIADDLPEVCAGERGIGLLRGLVLREGRTARELLPKFAAAGLLLTAAGDRVIRFTPPLVVTDRELTVAADLVHHVLRALA